MRSTLAKRSLVGLVVVLLATVASASVQGTFQRTYQVTGSVDLEVLTHSGDIIVRGGPAGTVSVSGKIHVGNYFFDLGISGRRADVQELEKNPPIRQTGNSIRIDYVNMRNISIDYEITVPQDTRVRTRTGSGDQTLETLTGTFDLESGSGDMRLRDLNGEVHLHTGSGDVEGRNVSGAITARAGSGDINIEQSAKGDVDVQTGSGNIELRGLEGGLHAEAGSGDLTVEAARVAPWQIRTGSGNVRVHLPSDAAFNLEANTSSGSVIVDQPVTMTVQGRVQESRKAINGTVRGGGPLLAVHTGSGDVHIE
jgi:Putative adhesin